MDQQFVFRMDLCANVVGSVAALARKAGISQSGIRKYYQGTEPTRPVLLALSEAAGVNLVWLSSGHGPVCDLESPLLIYVKQQVVKNFHFSRQINEFIGLCLKDAADCYCDYYNKGTQPGLLPDFVQVVIPTLDWNELCDWSIGKFSTQPKCLRSEKASEALRSAEGWVQAPADLVVAVARELPQALGDEYLNLDRRKEAYLLRSVVDFLREQSAEAREEFLSSALLRLQIRYTSHMYDQNEKRRHDLSSPHMPGIY